MSDKQSQSGQKSQSLSAPAGSSQPSHNGNQAAQDAIAQLRDSLRSMLDDPKVPSAVRDALQPEYSQLEAQLEKLEHGHVHIAVFGRVSVGKSSLLNALLGEARFQVSPLHGATQTASMSDAVELNSGNVYFIDTPGIDEIAGESREQQAHAVAKRADLLLFVVAGDLTRLELDALTALASIQRPLLLVLNKADHFNQAEQASLRQRLTEHSHGLVKPQNIILTRAQPASVEVVRVDADGNESVEQTQPAADIAELRERLWQILEREGKALAALNAGLFAGELADITARRIIDIKRDVAKQVVQRYCLAKGLSVAFNPVPVADLVAAASLDVALVYHLSRVYGLPLTRAESGKLVTTIFSQLAVLMGTVWGMHLLSSVLKTFSAGLSVAITAAGQGAVAWYATYITGEAARRYFENGASWGSGGPKRAVKRILDEIDRESILAEARAELRRRLNSSS